MRHCLVHAPDTHPIARVLLTEAGWCEVEWRDGTVRRFEFESDMHAAIGVSAETLMMWLRCEEPFIAWSETEKA